jgi:hypothetical protein
MGSRWKPTLKSLLAKAVQLLLPFTDTELTGIPCSNSEQYRINRIALAVVDSSATNILGDWQKGSQSIQDHLPVA